MGHERDVTVIAALRPILILVEYLNGGVFPVLLPFSMLVMAETLGGVPGEWLHRAGALAGRSSGLTAFAFVIDLNVSSTSFSVGSTFDPESLCHGSLWKAGDDIRVDSV